MRAKNLRLIQTIILTALCTALLGSAVPVAAKAPPGLQVTPLRAYPAQPPGVTTGGSLTLTNKSPQPLQVAMSAEVFRTINENYDYGFEGKGDADWVHFEKPTLTLTPNQSQVVSYSLAVPVGASPGGHYLSLVSTVSPTLGSEGVTEIRRVASLVYLEVGGKIVKKGNLVSANLPSLTTNATVLLDSRLANTGNTHFQARLGVTERRWPWHGSGRAIGQLQGFLLPATVRRLSSSIVLPSSPGIYQVTVEFAAPQGGVTRQNHTIIYTPAWFLVICLLIIGGYGGFLLVRVLRTRHTKRHVKL